MDGWLSPSGCDKLFLSNPVSASCLVLIPRLAVFLKPLLPIKYFSFREMVSSELKFWKLKGLTV
jgi:hypothetical protein